MGMQAGKSMRGLACLRRSGVASESAMFQQAVPHHVTGEFTSHRKFLADKEYGEALDTIVKGCSDLLLQSPDGAKVFIGKRLVHPQPDWWFVGGRIFPGETPVQSCCRLLRRELSLEIEPARFQTVCCQSLAWGMRQQAPMTNGTTDTQVVLSLRLTEAEVEKVVLDPKEYETSMWIEPAELLAGHFHPALKFAVASMRAAAKLRQLQEAVAAKPDNDVEIAALARDFCALAKETPPAGVSDYRVKSESLQYECAVDVKF